MVELFAPVKQGKMLEGKMYLFDLNYPKVLNIGTYLPSVPQDVRAEVAGLLEKVKSGQVKP
jgi:hypothetical protein